MEKSLITISEEQFRDYDDWRPLEKYEPQSRQSYMITAFLAYKKRDEKMIEQFTELLNRKMNRLDKMRDIDLFSLSETEAEKTQKQITWMEDEVHILSYIAKIIVRHFERWFEPEMQKMTESVIDTYDKAEKEAQYWQQLYLQELESQSFMCQLALKMTEKQQQTEQKLNRYQTLFIQKNIQV